MNANTINTPKSTATLVDMVVSGSPIDKELYRGIIVSFSYLTTTKLNIVFCFGLYASFNKIPKCHM